MCQFLNDKIDCIFTMRMCSNVEQLNLGDEVPNHMFEGGVLVPDRIVFRMRDIDRPDGFRLAPMIRAVDSDRLDSAHFSDEDICFEIDADIDESANLELERMDGLLDTSARNRFFESLRSLDEGVCAGTDVDVDVDVDESSEFEEMHGVFGTSARKRFFDSLHTQVVSSESPGAVSLALIDSAADAEADHPVVLNFEFDGNLQKPSTKLGRNAKSSRKPSGSSSVADAVVSSEVANDEDKKIPLATIEMRKQRANETKQRRTKRLADSASTKGDSLM